MTKKNENQESEPLYVNREAIRQQNASFESFLDKVNELAEGLEKEGVKLDEKLLDDFLQNGHPAISKRIMAGAEAQGNMKYLHEQVKAGAIRSAAQFQGFYDALHTEILRSGHGLESITFLNNRACPRGGVLEEITRRNTITLKSPEDREFYEQISKFAKQFNEMTDWVKQNRPDLGSFRDEVIIALTEVPFYMDRNFKKTMRDDTYMILESTEEISNLVVNPLYFAK
jgi:hypothetical protein